MRYLTFLAALLASGSALAQADTGFYLEGKAGWSFPRDPDISARGLDGELELEDAPVFGGALGWRFGAFRLEADASWRKNDIDSARTEGGIEVDGSGDVSTLVGMVNLFVEPDLGLPVRPYIGGGVGGAWIKLDASEGDLFEIDDDVGAFAWNLAAGLAFDVTESLALTATYRYLRLEGTDFSADLAGVDVGDVDVDDIESHEVLLGLRYTF